MRFRIASLALAAVFTLPAATVAPNDGIVAHEWGTFTSVADRDGYSVYWKPLVGPSDLPCFVHRLGEGNYKWAPSKVRMETPVLYFYTPAPATIAVDVRFPRGLITEWYPRASGAPTVNSPSGIQWNSVQLTPGRTAESPVEKGPSHYYAARATDAVALRSAGEQDNLLFYRGVADFGIPLLPAMKAGGMVEIRKAETSPIDWVVLFENRGGKIGYRVVRSLDAAVTLDMPELSGSLASLRQEIEGVLTAHGLYPKEARAMLNTWGDSWFEEGARVFYIVPPSKVDAVLPLKITPAPRETARVFVGRVELLSPLMEKEIEAALGSGDIPALKKYGRFLNAFVPEIGRRRGAEPVQTSAAKRLLETQFTPPACAQ